MNEVRFIGAAEIDASLDWPGLVEALLRFHRTPRARIADLHFAMAGNGLLNRAAWIEGLGSGLKTVSVFPGNARLDPPRPTVQGVFVLFDDFGSVRAIIDGAALTRWKTVGDSMLGARLLARPDSATLLLVGAGTISSTLARAYPVMFPSLKRILVWNRTRARAAELAESVGGEVVEDLAASVADADIVSCATISTEPIVRGRWLKPGAHLDLIGAFKPDMREADDDAMRRGRLFVDARDTTLGEIGELILPMQAGAITEADVLGDFYDLAADASGRRDPGEITVFKNGGGAHLDLMTAAHILDRLGS
ncbi:MAG: ornithine cyclodeaminase family protein [Rhodocyclaceae bacterium]